MSRESLVPIKLPADPEQPLEAATKQYVDGKVVGGGTDEVWVGTAAPADPNIELWYDTDATMVTPGIAVQDENVGVAGNVSTLDFRGPGVVAAAGVAGEAIVTVGADTGWIAMTLTGGWTDYGSTWPTCAYRMKDGVVYLKGLCRAGTVTANTVLTTLPAGYRLGHDSHVGVTCSIANVMFRLNVMRDGVIKVNNAAGLAAGGWVSFDHLSWIADL